MQPSNGAGREVYKGTSGYVECRLIEEEWGVEHGEGRMRCTINARRRRRLILEEKRRRESGQKEDERRKGDGRRGEEGEWSSGRVSEQGRGKVR
eukprot:318133-Hanusia_phi.AAC.3